MRPSDPLDSLEPHPTGLQRLAKTWNRLGEEDPLWAILSAEDKRGNRWDRDEFFATGRKEIEEVLTYARAQERALRSGRALDFGCGVGRLSQALAGHFEEVHGVDIAASMIAQARQLNEHEGVCSYHLNTRPDLALFEDRSFDFIYSNITLQHMQPALAHGYIAEFCRILARGGMLIFQLPTEPLKEPSRWHVLVRAGYRLWLRRILGRPLMDMFATPRAKVSELVQAGGCRIIDTVESDQGGADWRGHRYCVVRGEVEA